MNKNENHTDKVVRVTAVYGTKPLVECMKNVIRHRADNESRKAEHSNDSSTSWRKREKE